MITNKEIEKLLKKVDSELTEKEKQFINQLLLEYKKGLVKSRHELAEIYYKYGDNVKFGEIKNFDKYVDLIVASIIGLYGFSTSGIQKHLESTYIKSVTGTAKAIEDLTKTRITITASMNYSPSAPPNIDLIKKALDNPFDKVKWKFRTKGHHEAAIQMVKDEIKNGLISGRGYSKTAANITEKVNGLVNNVVRIVRTESHRIQVKGRVDQLKKSREAAGRLGLNMQFKILSVMDDRTREQSILMNGQLAEQGILSDGTFGYGFKYPDGILYEYPGETGNAGWDINDRESVICVIL